MAGRYGDKAGWLKKKKPGKPWTTEFCIIRGTSFEIYSDDNIQDERVKPRQRFELRGALLDPKVPSTLLQGSLDAHHGTDQYSFMVTPRVEERGKRPERHVFKAMHEEEKTEWLRVLALKNGSRRGAERAIVSAPKLTVAEDDFEVDGVVSRLETYACLVSFRVQRKFIHLLNSPHEDYASLKSVVLGMVMASAAMPGHHMQPSSSERHLLGELAALREPDVDASSSEDDMPAEAIPASRAGGGVARASAPPSDGSEEDMPPALPPRKLSQNRARQPSARVAGFLPSDASDLGLRAPPPLPSRAGRSSRTPDAKSPQRATAAPTAPPPSPPPAAPPTPPPPPPPPPAAPPAPSVSELSTKSGSRFVPNAGDILLKKAALKHRQTVNRLAGHSVTAAKAELAKESSKASAAGGGPTGNKEIRTRARRRMSVLLQESPLHQDSMNAYNDWPFMTGEGLPAPFCLTLLSIYSSSQACPLSFAPPRTDLMRLYRLDVKKGSQTNQLEAAVVCACGTVPPLLRQPRVTSCTQCP